jgi:hypothetical protein
MTTNGTEERSGREVRLLALVIVVAVAGLLVLARFRFPGAEIVTVNPAPSPFERLAARPAFEEMAAAVGETANRLLPALGVAVFDHPEERPSRKSAPVPRVPVLVPTLRARQDVSIAYAPPGLQLRAVGSAQPRIDSKHDLAWIPPAGDDAGDPRAAQAVVELTSGAPAFAGSSFVIVVEAGVAGAAARPVFIPRVDQVPDDRWSAPLLRIGGQPQLLAGSFLFTLDGHLIGIIVPQDTGMAIASAGLLNRMLLELTGPSR